MSREDETEEENAPEEVPEALYQEGRIIVQNEDQANKIHERGSVGKPLSGGRLQLAPVEALLLLDEERLRISHGTTGEELDFSSLMDELSEKDPEFVLKYRVYEDLRSRGFVVKTGLKYGAHFRVYERGETPGTSHSPYLVHAISESEEITPPDLARAVRLAQSVRKKMMYAVVDDEGDITYYSLSRERM